MGLKTNKKRNFKIKNILKSRLFFFVIGALVFGTIGVGAATLLYSKDITYDNTESGLSSTNLQDALDELYEQAKNAPSCDSNGVCTVTCPSGLNYFATSTGYLCVPKSVSIGGKSISIVTSGDGLYADSVENERYFYRGTNVNNYITFNNETWRIISVENNGTLKIIRNERLSSTYAWDALGTRNSSTSTYCTNASDMGCNAWSATAKLVGAPTEFVQYYPSGNPTSYKETYTGTVTEDASLNTYLNGMYYSGLSSVAKAQVVKGTFNVSSPGSAHPERMEVDAEQEKQYQWQGYVALATVTEYLRASTSSGCTSLSAGYNGGKSSTCSSNNWLWPTSYEWTLSPDVHHTRRSVWFAFSGGYVLTNASTSTFGIRPVLHLSANITLSGSGTQSDPYTIN